jgi:hypothetical protein
VPHLKLEKHCGDAFAAFPQNLPANETHPVQVIEALPARRHARDVRLLVNPRRDDLAVEIVEAVIEFRAF